MVGELVMGRFRVLERIGSGGMGTVYRAFDERLQRHVALKEIAGMDAPRVLREAQAAARLNHPGIVTLYELGSDGDRTLLVSELVAGGTLAELCRAGRVSDRDVAEIGVDLAHALAHAHARGVVHRDVKPSNVVIRDDEEGGLRAKLMDFGIASIAGASTLTATGEVVGSLAYMAPEQAEGQPAGPPADVYSLGLALYECWAGLHPVAGRTPAQTARAIGEPVTPLGEQRPDLPDRLSACIDACLYPEPDRRPSLTELHETLIAAISRLDAEQPVPDRRSIRPPEWAVRGRVAHVALLLALGGGVALLARPAGGPALTIAVGVLAALTMSWVLHARHIAIALLGALFWSAGLETVLRVVEQETVPGRAALIAVTSGAVVAIEFRLRSGAPPRPAALRPALGSGRLRWL